MRGIADQNNSEYGRLLCSVYLKYSPSSVLKITVYSVHVTNSWYMAYTASKISKYWVSSGPFMDAFQVVIKVQKRKS